MVSATLSVDGARLRLSSDGKKIVGVELLPLGGTQVLFAEPAAAGRDRVLTRACLEVRQYLLGRRRGFSVPFDQPGSDFFQRVWRALAEVPYGRVVSYAELARKAGKPGAARAVGTAMNRNRLPLLVPCHRVLASAGIGGFGCGLAWKRRLLELEKPWA